MHVTITLTGDEVIVYDNAVAVTVIPEGGSNPNDSLLNDLVYWFEMNEESGARVDAHAGNQAVEVGQSVLAADGLVGRAANFVAANTHELRCQSSADLQAGHFDFSVAAWVYLNANNVGHHRPIVAKSNEYFMRVGGTGVMSWHLKHTDELVGATVSPGVWHHLYGEYDSVARKIRMRLDLGQVYEKDITVEVAPTNDALEFGSYFGLAAPGLHDGRTQHVAFWKRKLTDAEISRRWNGGAGMAYPGQP